MFSHRRMLWTGAGLAIRDELLCHWHRDFETQNAEPQSLPFTENLRTENRASYQLKNEATNGKQKTGTTGAERRKSKIWKL